MVDGRCIKNDNTSLLQKYIREGVKKKKNKKHGFLHVLYFDPPAPPKHGLFFFFGPNPPLTTPPPHKWEKISLHFWTFQTI